MLSVLINAYACAPNRGSEPGVGWNWITAIAKHCIVYAITEGEFQEEIEKELQKLPQKDNIIFYYLPLSEKTRKMCWNQGDWRFYYYYDKWQKNAYKLALEIISKNKIDIIHQLNMIGFREPGYLWKIQDRPFLWGPIGGMNMFPEAYLQHAGHKRFLFEFVKNKINLLQIRFHHRVRKAIKRADGLIAAIPETSQYILSVYGKESVLINETGTNGKVDQNMDFSHFYETDSFDLLWVGRFVYFKQLGLALQTIAKSKRLKGLKLHIVGSGFNNERDRYEELARKLDIEDYCIWYGSISNTEVHKMMKNSHLFFFSSVSEGTSTVVLEALGNGLPVLCFNTCGFGAVVDNTVGMKIELTNPDQSSVEFSKWIEYFYNNRDELVKRSQNCSLKIKQFSWDEKMKQLLNIYDSTLKKYENNSADRKF